MPRYKVVCSCKKEFWVLRRRKLNDEEKIALQGRGRSICHDCGELLRQRIAMIRTGVYVPIPADEAELQKTLTLVRENKPWGFERTPAREYLAAMVAKDRESLAEGIKTRYRGFSPTYETYRLQYRVLVGEYILREAA